MNDHRPQEPGEALILLGQLVSAHQLQAGIALAVARNVWHWSGTKRIWAVQDIIDVLTNNDLILISDADGVLSCNGIPVGFGPTTKRCVQRGDYVQAVLLQSSQAVDILRQIRTSE